MNKTTALTTVFSEPEAISWDEVYETQLPRLYNYCLYRVGHPDAAEDLCATIFERAWKKRGSYRKDLAGIPTWLFGFARNVLREYFRQENHRRTTQVSLDEASGVSHDPRRGERRLQQKEALLLQLAELPDRERDLISWKYGAGLSNSEIARLAHLSETNVGTILSRTIHKLRKNMEAENE